MLDWWIEQPPHLRTTVALIPLTIGAASFFVGAWRVGITLTAVGVVLLAVSFPSSAERNGFHDF